MSQILTSRAMRGATQAQMLHRRDAAGDEMDALAKIMQDPNPDAEQVTGYIRKLLKDGHVSGRNAAQILASIPHDPSALRDWARRAFIMVAHQGIHAHAAFPRQIYPSQPQAAPAGAPADDNAPPGAPAGQA